MTTIAELKEKQQAENVEQRAGVLAEYRRLITQDTLQNGQAEQLKSVMEKLGKTFDDPEKDLKLLKRAADLEKAVANHDQLLAELRAEVDKRPKLRKELDEAQNAYAKCDVTVWHLQNRYSSLCNKQGELARLKSQNKDLFSV